MTESTTQPELFGNVKDDEEHAVRPAPEAATVDLPDCSACRFFHKTGHYTDAAGAKWPQGLCEGTPENPRTKARGIVVLCETGQVSAGMFCDRFERGEAPW